MSSLRGPTSSEPYRKVSSRHVFPLQPFPSQTIWLTAPQEGQERSVTLFDDRPALIARLMFWLYCGSYEVYRSLEVQGLTVNDVLASGLRHLPQVTSHPHPSSRLPSDNNQAEDTIIIEGSPCEARLKRKRDDADYPAATVASLVRPSTATSRKSKTPEERTKTATLEHWDMYVLADKYGCPELRSYCVRSIFAQARQKRSSIWHVVDCVTTASIPVEDIRQEMIGFFRLHCKEFLGDARFEELVRNTPELAWVLVKEYAGRR